MNTFENSLKNDLSEFNNLKDNKCKIENISTQYINKNKDINIKLDEKINQIEHLNKWIEKKEKEIDLVNEENKKLSEVG